MNNIDLCLNEVYNTIPCEILNAVFHDDEMTVRECLKKEIWDKILLLDMDAFGGEKIDVELTDIPYKLTMTHGKQYRTYKIPKDRTREKNITSVLSIVHTPFYLNSLYTTGFASTVNNNPARASMQRTMNALTPSTTVQVSEAKLIGLNLICAHFPNYFYGPDQFKMTCIVQNDYTLNNFDLKAMEVIVKLFLLATKRYIYKKLVILMDQGQTIGGYEIGQFKDIVDSYEEAFEQYEEEKSKIGYYSMVSNEKSRYDFFKMINSYR